LIGIRHDRLGSIHALPPSADARGAIYLAGSNPDMGLFAGLYTCKHLYRQVAEQE
jgi:hypothetical protein